MTRYNPKDWPASLCSNNIAKHIRTDGDHRFANHHYHPSTVTDSEVLQTLDQALHKDVIRSLFKPCSNAFRETKMGKLFKQRNPEAQIL